MIYQVTMKSGEIYTIDADGVTDARVIGSVTHRKATGKMSYVVRAISAKGE